MATAIQAVAVGVIQHSERYGKIWFGAIFWGSVLNAAAQRVGFPGEPFPLALAAVAVGATVGAVAHARGRWL